MLQPARKLEPAPRLVCREGQLEELLPLLAAHRLDMVLADEAAGAGHNFKVFNHSLGSCGVTFCAAPAIAAKLRKGFRNRSIARRRCCRPKEHHSGAPWTIGFINARSARRSWESLMTRH